MESMPFMPIPLEQYEWRQLHRKVCAALNRDPAAAEAGHLAEVLTQPGACFVALYKGDEAVATVGGLKAERPRWQTACQHALRAVQKSGYTGQLENLELEISLLSPLKQLQANNEKHLLSQLQPGKHGLVICSGPACTTFLPQMWQQLPEPGEFVRALKRQAGWRPDLWPAHLTFWVYTADVYRAPFTVSAPAQ